MKTSLIIDDRVFQTAKREAQTQHKTISELISYWAGVGLDYLKKQDKPKRKLPKPLNLGEPKIDLSSRKEMAKVIYE